MQQGFLIVSIVSLLLGCAKADKKPIASTLPPTPPATIIYQRATLTAIGDTVLEALVAAYPNFANTDSDSAATRPLGPELLGYSLAPDGQRVVLWLLEHDRAAQANVNWVCVVNFSTSAATCNPTADRIARLEDGLMVWSPDGRYLAFHTDWAITQRDTDLYVVDVESATLLNLTGLPTEGRSINDVRQGTFVLIDYAPFWSPDGAYLYFLRFQPQAFEEGEGHEWGDLKLMRVQVSNWRYEEMMTLPESISPARLIGANQISISPDGTQLALLLYRLPSPDGTTDLWRLNLKTQSAELWVAQADLVAALPPFVDMERTAIYANDVEWAAGGQQVVIAVIADLTFSRGGPLKLYSLLDVATKTLSPLDDLHQYTTIEDLAEASMIRRVILSVDGTTLFALVGQMPRATEQPYRVVAQPLTSAANPYTVAEIVISGSLLRATSPQEHYTRSIFTASTNGNVWLQFPPNFLPSASLLTLQ